MKCYHLQVNRWNWKTSYYMKLARLRRPKIACALSYADYRLSKRSDIIGHRSHTQGRTCIGRIGKERKPKT
jgi:hypothetical protein